MVERQQCFSDDDHEHRDRKERATGDPAPVRDSWGILRVRPSDRGCAVEWHAAFEPADPAHADQITTMMRANFADALESLRRRIETVPVGPHE